MKKILWLLIVGFIFGIHSVCAKETSLIMVEEPNVFYAMYNDEFYRSYSFNKYYQDGSRVYCIDPDQKVNSYQYEEVSSSSLYSEDTLKKLALIEYFGSDYPGHDSLRFELATQALIWEEIKGVTVKWFTERYSYGEEIDVTYEREKILDLIHQYLIKPNFNLEKIEGTINDHITVTDQNHVLGEYEVASFDGGTAYIEGDDLKLVLKEKGNYTLKLKRKAYETGTKYYVASNSQTMMKGRVEEEWITIPVEVSGSEVTIQKYGIKIEGDKIPLEGVSFELRAGETLYYQDQTVRFSKDEFIGNYETNTNGEIHLTLPYGNYYLKETKTKEGFELNPRMIPIHVESSSMLFEIENQESYGSIQIQKIDSITKKPLMGVKYRITNLQTNEVYEKSTNAEGMITFDQLRFGSYQLEEIETLPHYIMDTSIKIVEIKEQKNYTYSFVNEPVPDIPDTDCYEVPYLNSWVLLAYAIYQKKFF